MKKIYPILMLGIGAMLAASCSVDEKIQSGDTELLPVTITATIPDDGMTTRVTADGDPDVQYCYVQILDADGNSLDGQESAVRTMQPVSSSTTSFSLTVKLNPNANYTVLFWADNATSAAPTTLSNVSYTNGDNIAYAGKITNQRWTASGFSCTLDHVVTRISVRTTADTTIEGTRTLTVTVPEVYTAYDVLTGVPVSGQTQNDFVYNKFTTATGATDGNPVQMGFFYVMCPASSTQAVVLQYNGYLKNPAVTFSNFPTNPDYHVILQGNVADAGLVEAAIAATIDTAWGNNSTVTVASGTTNIVVP